MDRLAMSFKCLSGLSRNTEDPVFFPMVHKGFNESVIVRALKHNNNNNNIILTKEWITVLLNHIYIKQYQSSTRMYTTWEKEHWEPFTSRWQCSQPDVFLAAYQCGLKISHGQNCHKHSHQIPGVVTYEELIFSANVVFHIFLPHCIQVNDHNSHNVHI